MFPFKLKVDPVGHGRFLNFLSFPLVFLDLVVYSNLYSNRASEDIALHDIFKVTGPMIIT